MLISKSCITCAWRKKLPRPNRQDLLAKGLLSGSMYLEAPYFAAKKVSDNVMPMYMPEIEQVESINNAVLSDDIRLIDVHAHIDSEEFDKDLDEVIDRAQRNSVIGIINSALGPKYIQKALDIEEKYYGYVFLCFGLEPYNLSDNDFYETVNLIKRFKDKIYAVGEVGLDYYWVSDHSQREIMRERFIQFIELARELHKPLVIHSRSAGKYAIQILIENDAEKVLMHAFDGKASVVKRGVEAGYFFSVPTSVVYSKQKQKMVKVLPLENMMLETDSPVLSPNKDKRNEPANVIYSLEKVAEIKNFPKEDVARITTENAIMFFRLPLKI